MAHPFWQGLIDRVREDLGIDATAPNPTETEIIHWLREGLMHVLRVADAKHCPRLLLSASAELTGYQIVSAPTEVLSAAGLISDGKNQYVRIERVEMETNLLWDTGSVPNTGEYRHVREIDPSIGSVAKLGFYTNYSRNDPIYWWDGNGAIDWLPKRSTNDGGAEGYVVFYYLSMPDGDALSATLSVEQLIDDYLQDLVVDYAVAQARKQEGAIDEHNGIMASIQAKLGTKV